MLENICSASFPCYGKHYFLTKPRCCLCILFKTTFWLPLAMNRCWPVKWNLFLSLRVSSVAQSCLTLCDPIDCSLPGSSVHRIFQARILEWLAISFSKGSSQPQNRTWVSCVSCIAHQSLTHWAIGNYLHIKKWTLLEVQRCYSECSDHMLRTLLRMWEIVKQYYFYPVSILPNIQTYL